MTNKTTIIIYDTLSYIIVSSVACSRLNQM